MSTQAATTSPSLSVDVKELIDRKLISAYFCAAMTAFFLSLFAGLLYSLQLLQHWPLPKIAIFSPGRIRFLHTNLIAYGFIANAFLGAVCYVVPRLTRVPLKHKYLNWSVFWLWQLMLLSTLFGIMLGHAQGIEWGETPQFADPLVAVAWVLFVISMSIPIIQARQRNMYVTLWYFSAAFVWTALTYLMGNYIPQHFVAGAAGGAIAGLFIHDLVGLFVTPIGWGLMYYFVPVILKKPVWSHALSLVGFWGLAFFYPLNGIHHFIYSPIPEYLQYGAIVSTIAVEFVVTTVVINFFGTLWGRGDALRSSMPIRWFYVGMVFYFITCLQCSFQVTQTFQKIIHFTDWVVGHAHLVMFGVFGFWILGIMTYLWPKLCGAPWAFPKLLGWHFWLSTIGLAVMVIDLTIAGLVVGFMWEALAPWIDTVKAARPFWLVRTVSGVAIIIGQLLFAYNMAITWVHGRAYGFDAEKLAEARGGVLAGPNPSFAYRR
jgi:cytochrome c oxidase cbb3-type subunit 1